MSLQIEIKPRWLGTTFEVSYFIDGSDRQYFNPEGRYTWSREELPGAISALMEELTQPAETPEPPQSTQSPQEGESAGDPPSDASTYYDEAGSIDPKKWDTLVAGVHQATASNGSGFQADPEIDSDRQD